ncbi:MAG: 30S ribosomal protein S12 methylthiotransferase RimO, partial [Deltaproteobacteria bacterium]|nr:30S ribosomal protein S12 methylthiotransferase RimO [Deltaproteobacteria bacterium]
MKKTVHFVSLGCAKNRVDSEVMLGHLTADGYEVVHSPEHAQLIVVNTCAFIDAAKEESVDTILEMARYKDDSAKQLVVAGCLSQRYAPALAREIPEVDHFLGTGNFESIAHVVGGRKSRLPIVGQDAARPHARLTGPNALKPFRHMDPDAGVAIPDPDFTITAASPRVRTLPAYTTYVKVSEGCSNTCAFCIIPKLRGPQRSRPVADVVAEVARLAEAGAVEVNLIAQDLCAYGKDLTPRQSLAQLLRALDNVGAGLGRRLWVRCLYLYPRGLTDEVIDVVAGATHVLPYLDMPLQHISDPILRRMRRGKGGPATWKLLRQLRARIPNLTLRTTFITGLPGETEADFAELCEFVEEIRFERMGVFTYSREEDTPAAEMSAQVDPEVAAQRRDTLMAIQRRISREQQGS